MPHNKRTCNRKARASGRTINKNYINDRVARKALRKEKLARQARKQNRTRK